MAVLPAATCALYWHTRHKTRMDVFMFREAERPSMAETPTITVYLQQVVRHEPGPDHHVTVAARRIKVTMLCNGEPMTHDPNRPNVFLSEHQLTVSAPVLAEVGVANPLCTSLIKSVVNAAIKLHNESGMDPLREDAGHSCPAQEQHPEPRMHSAQARSTQSSEPHSWNTASTYCGSRPNARPTPRLRSGSGTACTTSSCTKMAPICASATGRLATATADTMMSATQMGTPTWQTGPTAGTSTPLPRKVWTTCSKWATARHRTH